MDKKKYLATLKKINLFSGISDNTLIALLDLFSITKVKEGQVLFKQGDASDALYILLSGHLLAILENDNGTVDLVGKVRAGNVIGEMGFLSQKPRALTIKAIDNASLLKLSQGEFDKFLALSPNFMRHILSNTIDHNQATLKAVKDKISNNTSNYIFAIAAGDQDSLYNFAHNVDKYVNEREILVTTHKQMEELYKKNKVAAILDYLDKVEESYQSIIYIANSKESKINEIFLSKSHAITVVANGLESPNYNSFAKDLLSRKELKNLRLENIKKELVLLWPKDAKIQNTRKWLESADYSLHYHIKPTAQDYHRLFRFYKGKAIGLVLSGGGARGWGHLGIIKALQEKNIPIDVIGSVSIGSVVGGVHLITENWDQLHSVMQKLNAAMSSSVSLRQITWPYISIYNASDITLAIKEYFGGYEIEDLPIYFYSIIVNINTNKEVVRRSGSLADTIRASGSLPGLFPPVVENGELLIDGG